MENKQIKILIYLLVFILLMFLVSAVAVKTASAPHDRQAVSQPKVVVSAAKTEVDIKTLPVIAPTAAATTTIIFGGDVMLSRVVGQKIEKYNDFSWPFKNIASRMSVADLAVVNLESPMTIGGSHLVKTGSFSFNADPRSVAGLNSAGIDLVSLANNHSLNQGSKGISDTQKILTENQIGFIGAGLNDLTARNAWIKEINQFKFGFLAYAYPDDYSVATTNTPGIANMDIAKMKADIAKLKKQADIVIILMHAGTEYKNVANSQQKEFAHVAIDAGADLVVGHHPHWVQNIEKYNNKPIIYSLGNLVFDQMWSKETQDGALAEVTWTDKKIDSIEMIPIRIKDYGQPMIIADNFEKNVILERMGLKSSLIR